MHAGISYFICPMDSPGVTVRPLVDMTGTHTFNEVYLDEVRLPDDCLIGARGQGWTLAKVTLANERVSLSAAGSLWGMGPPPTTWPTPCDDREGRPTRSTGNAWPRCGPRGRSSGGCASGRCQRPWPVPNPVPRRRCARRWPMSTAST